MKSQLATVYKGDIALLIQPFDLTKIWIYQLNFKGKLSLSRNPTASLSSFSPSQTIIKMNDKGLTLKYSG